MCVCVCVCVRVCAKIVRGIENSDLFALHSLQTPLNLISLRFQREFPRFRFHSLDIKTLNDDVVAHRAFVNTKRCVVEPAEEWGEGIDKLLFRF